MPTTSRFRFKSTYLSSSSNYLWLRGNHHGHSTRSDGQLEPHDVVHRYEEAGYHYLALSEHDRLWDVTDLQTQTSLCLIPAVEISASTHQTLMYLGATSDLPARTLTPRQIMEQVHALGGLFIFDHPNWRPFEEYATDAVLDALIGLKGVEIYTGVIERLPGEANATNRWDYLLSKGWHVFGHATDDQHAPEDYFIAWNQVQWPSDVLVTWRGIVDALATGRFYASTGVRIDSVSLSDDQEQITIISDAEEVHWISTYGAVLKKTKGGTSTIDLDEFVARSGFASLEAFHPHSNCYLRAECFGCGNTSAWTQPFWIENTASEAQ